MRQKSLRGLILTGTAALGVAAAAVTSLPTSAHACGGFFCSSTNPVNQAAEQIIFSQNGDGTVTAVIQILYEGPSTKFAWLLPVPGTPTIAVSSDQALAVLKQATNPQYQLQTVFPDGCQAGFSGNSGGPTAAPGVAEGDNGGVTVQASGAIGPYDYEVISVKPDLADSAQVALDWLTQNGFDVGDIGADVLRPYLDSGLNLLAIRLSKGSNTGSIRPVMVTYDSELPSIPIRPTAVAANDDMGVMVWVLSGSRAIPSNYKALELNDALIDWFNPNNNYNKVVSRAADEAMGQGFVTEYAGKVADLKNNTGFSIWQPYQQQTWDQFTSSMFTDPVTMIQQANANWQGFDGIDDALRAAVVLPDTITFDDFKNCTQCFITDPGVTFDTTEYLKQLYKMVIKPMIDTQDLIDSRPYMTRLYTTMSADEMTLDPVFDFNADIEDVSNIHVQMREIVCDKNTTDPFNAPWNVEFPQGIVHGTEQGVWPIAIDDQPAALKILEYAKKGQGKVLTDNTDDVLKMLAKNGTPTTKPSTGSGGSGGGGTSAGGGGGSSGSGAGGKGGTMTGTGSPDAGAAGSDAGMSGTQSAYNRGGDCSVGGGQPSSALSLLLFACAALLRRRR